jgi:hypothetical protein
LATDIHASFREIVLEIKRIQEPGGLRASIGFSGWITDTSGGQVVLTTKIEKEIRAVADWLREQRPTTKSQHTLKEWRSFVRSTFADPLAALDFSAKDEENAKKLKKAIETALDAAPKTAPILFMTIGCTLFQEPLSVPLAIGPVLFETKSDWLARAERAGQIAPKVRKRLERAFAGRRLAKPKDHWQKHDEDAILGVLKSSKLVCTVETRDLAPAMAEVRAVIGARLALTALTLFWQKPSSALEGFHLSVDPGSRWVKRLYFVPSGKHAAGGSRLVGNPHGQSVKPKTLSAFLGEARDLLDVAGRMIECWTNTDAYDQATPILRSLAQSLFFFSAGCREENDLMAIVKFISALETLAQGQKATKIAALLKARIRFKKNAKIYADKDIDVVVDWLYSKHRSRTLHGTNPDILHDWSDARGVAETLARLCLVNCMDWAIQNPTESDPKKLLT